MIEHTPWRGAQYERGIEGTRYAILGYSHWHELHEADADNTTDYVLSRVISGEWHIAFFTQIKNYFEFESHSEFWNRVLFLTSFQVLLETAMNVSIGAFQPRFTGHKRVF